MPPNRVQSCWLALHVFMILKWIINLVLCLKYRYPQSQRGRELLGEKAFDKRSAQSENLISLMI